MSGAEPMDKLTIVIKALVTLCIVCLCGVFVIFGVATLSELRHGFNAVSLLSGVFFIIAPLLACGFAVVLTWDWD